MKRDIRRIRLYAPEHPSSWSGRIDDPEDWDSFRWHQLIEFIDLREKDLKPLPSEKKGFCFLGYCCDRGVKKNVGRGGADRAPSFIRNELSNHPRSFDESTQIFDSGNIKCPEEDQTQVNLGEHCNGHPRGNP